ncbi:hypothetical protein PP707_03350 [Acetobacter pasteurianus]|nr:hypothetical protein [Acetobacter pasteurianus]
MPVGIWSHNQVSNQLKTALKLSTKEKERNENENGYYSAATTNY